MKKNNKITSLLVVIILSGLSVFGAFADTIYNYDGYRYTIINNFSVSVCGADTGLSQPVIPATINSREVVDISNRAFMNNTEITSVDFSEATHLQRIGLYAFKGCSNLSSDLIIPQTITTLETAAFEDCVNLSSVTISANVTEIAAQCFNRCSMLSSVTLHDGITSFGNYAFANCPNLTYLELSKDVTSIASSAFKNDTNLILGVWYDSYAHQFAKKHNIPFKLLDEFMLGDANMDGFVNINDVTAVQRNLAELEDFNELQESAADANCDGDLDISDATAIQMFLAEYEIPYPIGEIITQ